MAHSKIPDDAAKSVRRRKIASIVSIILILIVFGLISYFVGVPLVRQFRESPETFRAYVASHGMLGKLLMIGVVMLQVVVALIPGEPFELGAGFVFGWLEGSVLCVIGMALASCLVYLAVRKWGVQVAELFFPMEKIRQYSFLKNEKKLDLLVCVLFLIPGTPKDLLTCIIRPDPHEAGHFSGADHPGPAALHYFLHRHRQPDAKGKSYRRPDYLWHYRDCQRRVRAVVPTHFKGGSAGAEPARAQGVSAYGKRNCAPARCC